jgi:hypothetical protein
MPVLTFALKLCSIPHASPPTNGHQGLSISPTNSTSPVKESVLSRDDSDNDNAFENETTENENENETAATDPPDSNKNEVPVSST